MIFRRFLTGNYSQIDNGLINDVNLSWKAKGILIYLLSKPSHWRPKVADIMAHAKDGRDSVLSGLHELEEQHYIWKVRISRNGFNCCEYWVYDIKVHENPSLKSENPTSENPIAYSNTILESKYPKGYGDREQAPLGHGAPDGRPVTISQSSAGSEELFPSNEISSPSTSATRSLSNHSRMNIAEGVESKTREETKTGRGKRLSVPKTRTHGQKEFLDIWCEEYFKAKGRKYIIAYGKDNAAVKRLLATGMASKELIEIARAAWASSNNYIFSLAADIPKFASNINAIADAADKNVNPRNDVCEFRVY